MFVEKKKIHFIGIGGSGMSAIAIMLHNMGFIISGSDLKKTELLAEMEKRGIRINIGHRKENLSDSDVVVYSSVIKMNNPEIIEAKNKKIPIIKRAEMLHEISRLKYSIAISGTHGKTTTTSMTAHILHQAGLDPSCIIGGRANNLSANCRLGRSKYIVFEADESDGSFLKYFPIIAVTTNIDDDHLDNYKNMENLRNAFCDFLNKVPFYGVAVLCSDDMNIKKIRNKILKNCITYGIESGDMRADKIKYKSNGTEYLLYENKKCCCKIELNMFGVHNVLNSLAAISVARFLNIDLTKIQKALFDFTGIARRLEFKGKIKGISFYDDYGHHPTEIKNTLKALIQARDQSRIFVIFQPHRYSRTKLLYKEFGKCFENVDFLFLMDIYPAGENPEKGISSELIKKAIKKTGKTKVELINDRKEIVKKIFSFAWEGDTVITIGAGDIIKFYDEELLF